MAEYSLSLMVGNGQTTSALLTGSVASVPPDLIGKTMLWGTFAQSTTVVRTTRI